MDGLELVACCVAIPAVCFTDPEIVTVGLSPDAARGAGHDVHVGQSSRGQWPRADIGAEDGFVRVTVGSDNHLLLGIAAVGAGVSELSTAFGLAPEMGARLEDIGGTIHAYPTLGEAFHEDDGLRTKPLRGCEMYLSNVLRAHQCKLFKRWRVPFLTIGKARSNAEQCSRALSAM